MAEPWAGVVETHTAALFFAGERVYKVRKPVSLDFLDLTDRRARRRACDQEVALNRRLAPDVYLGVATVGLEAEPSEPAVVMRRLPAGSSLSARILAGDEALPDLIVEVADALARFHADCPRVGHELPGDLWVSPLRLWCAEIHRMRSLHAPGVDDGSLMRALELARAYARGRAHLFAERLAAGLVRDGHGDLLASDIYLLPDGPRVLDCLEFDDRLRACDVLHDVAFLAMDLESLGRPDLARTLVDRYCLTAGESHPASLAHFFVAHRALIRAKVAAIRAQQRGDAADRTGADLLDLCLKHLDRAQVRAIVVGGLPGAGKTTLAKALAEALPARWLSSDLIRTELVTASTLGSRFDEGRYAPAVSDRVYRELLRRARAALERGEHVILDASWRTEVHRGLARELAGDADAVVVELLVQTDDCTAYRRLTGRAPVPGGSEATPEIRKRMQARFETWPQARVVEGDGRPDELAAAALAAINDVGKEKGR